MHKAISFETKHINTSDTRIPDLFLVHTNPDGDSVWESLYKIIMKYWKERDGY
jgi:hypothetical protein